MRQSEIRAKKLYRRLFNNLKKQAFDSKLDNTDIKLILSYKRIYKSSYAKTRINRATAKMSHIVKLNIYSLYKFTDRRAYSCYYKARYDYVKDIVKNKKLHRVFTILHELFHIYQNRADFRYNNTRYFNEKEFYADKFAIDYINKHYKQAKQDKTEQKTSKQETAQTDSKQEKKTCNACKQEKSLSDFRVYKQKRILNICKACEKAKARARQQAKKEILS